MLTITFPNFPSISTERLILREMSLATDTKPLLKLRSDPVAMRYIDKPLMQNLGEAEALIQKIQDSYNNVDGIQWAITQKHSNTMIGMVSFWKIDKEHHRAEVGYMLSPEMHGKGIMAEALRSVLEYGFGALNLHSVEANVNPLNEASIKLLEKAGFVREAYFRENYYFEGKFLDSAIYSLLTPL